MDCDLTTLTLYILDARANKDTEALAQYLLRFFNTPEDGVFYSQHGVAPFLQNMLSAKKTIVYKILESFHERKIITKIDQFSLQINPQFNSKGAKACKYSGSPLILTGDQRDYLAKLDAARLENWEMRGKNKKTVRHTRKKEQKETDMNTLLHALIQQLEEKDKQLKERAEECRNYQILIERIACGETISPAHAKRQLTLVKSESYER